MFVEAKKGGMLKNGCRVLALWLKTSAQKYLRTILCIAEKSLQLNVMDAFGCKEYIAAKLASLRKKIMH